MVREVALANAKAALEEAFTPKLQSMLSAKLSEDLDEGMHDEDDMDEGMYDEDDMDEGMHDEDDKKKIKESTGCKSLRDKLIESQSAYAAIKSELNEVNLLNSKLLYVNRIFKANNLDEAQKLRVVETLDNASNVKEAKLIYETIKDTFNVAKSKKASVKTKTKTLKENFGMASKAAGTSTAPKKEVISESSNMVNRFQKLANIKINQ